MKSRKYLQWKIEWLTYQQIFQNQTLLTNGEKEDMKHIHDCEILNYGEKSNLEYEKIFEGNISEQIQVFRTFERNLKRREHLKENKKDLAVAKLGCSLVQAKLW